VRKVCVVVGSRANYSSIKSAMRAIQEHRGLQLQLVVGASALLDRFGHVATIIEADGFRPDARAHMLVEGETPLTMAQSTGLGLVSLAPLLDSLRPDVVVTVGDRFETMATAVASAYMNIPLAHTMGGEVSGTIDESIRHAITKLSHVHFPATAGAAERIVRMGEEPDRVYTVGCPRIDLVAEAVAGGQGPSAELLERAGVGGHVDPTRPYLLVMQHPVTTEYGRGELQVQQTMAAVEDVGLPAVVMWPNADAGSEDVSRGMRKFRESHAHPRVRFFKNFPAEDFARLMKGAACMVGNSSAAIREGAFLGVPAVNVGSRQSGRERGANVRDVGYDRAEIAAAIRGQVEHGPYAPDPLYGDGGAGRRIADVLAGCPLRIDKRSTY
jgi:UDP-hydrolysing UDP-N-acetyl-D-glucosamine 2-epimerase